MSHKQHYIFCFLLLLIFSCSKNDSKKVVTDATEIQRQDTITQIDSQNITDTFTSKNTADDFSDETTTYPTEDYEYMNFDSIMRNSEDPDYGIPVRKRTEQHTEFDSTLKTIHIFVALCDNENQGIVPVPKSIGNGQKPSTNLYWGCGFGIKTYFKKSTEWNLIKTIQLNDTILERLIFKHNTKDFYLIADAYNGKYIGQCTSDFLSSACGKWKDTLNIQNMVIGSCGNAQLVAYIGHDGLMEFNISDSFQNTDGQKRDVIILACISRTFFSPYLEKANVNPIVWTKNLMAPEAYTIHDAITGYIKGESNQQILNRAIEAYASHQKKCGIKGAKSILVTGF